MSRRRTRSDRAQARSRDDVLTEIEEHVDIMKREQAIEFLRELKDDIDLKIDVLREFLARTPRIAPESRAGCADDLDALRGRAS